MNISSDHNSRIAVWKFLSTFFRPVSLHYYYLPASIRHKWVSSSHGRLTRQRILMAGHHPRLPTNVKYLVWHEKKILSFGLKSKLLTRISIMKWVIFFQIRLWRESKTCFLDQNIELESSSQRSCWKATSGQKCLNKSWTLTNFLWMQW